MDNFIIVGKISHNIRFYISFNLLYNSENKGFIIFIFADKMLGL